RSVFAVLGPDAVLAALGDERAVVRRVAIDEAVVTRDLRAGPRLVELLQDGEQPDEVRRAAAHAVGQLHLTIASEPLVALIVAPETVPLVRRECLVALGRTGGAQAFGVLDRALRAPVPEDREAALRGLGELRDPRAAHTLAELAVIANGKDLGSLAMLYLGRMGASLAVPAIRHQAQIQQDPAIHDELVLLLGGYQDPEAIPELMQLLRTPRHEADARVALMGTTGIDLGAAEDPWTVVDEWWRANRNKPQWQWLLDGLARADAATLLRPEHFGPSVEKEAIPELARLLTELDQPYLFVLASAVLRTVAREDFGVVSMQTSREARNGIAARYRVLYETSKAAQNR
ncbi:MAG: HEAT repeat domain-containing protein, partial [Planctomycetes bacterium]|nr:HEAT repeat domain-containing protein [Planctomycetota bacterium]